MTPDTKRNEPAAAGTEDSAEAIRDVITRARVVLWDFDGPICRLFAGHSAERVAAELVEWLESRGLHGLLTERERQSLDPQFLLRAVEHRHPGSDLVAELEERLTQEELQAVASAMPTAYADPLIRTWSAVGPRLAITTNNSARAARAYLAGRGLTGCFAPHIYGRTQDLHLLKPDPYCLNRALIATGVARADAVMIGDSPTDWEAASRAGIPFVGYARNDPGEKRLRAAGAGHVVRTLETLLRIVRR
ncbi:HAD family hydrolase [Streptomyces sp. NPDC046915]|uniref:HAD family hydrolase n=1 Tax=Streptomyces sp. NPDC046915 TaxID=3155257 RepID=UPI0033EEE85D